jgi:hypothetical protein
VSEWLRVAPDALLAVVLLLLPGLPAVLLLGLRGFAALATAPLVSVTLMAVLGEVCGLLGVSWGLLPLLVGVVLAVAVALVVGRVLREPRTEPQAWRQDLTALAATVLGSAFVLSAVVPGMRAPDRYPQAFDTSFHVNLIEWMTQHHDIAATHSQSIVSANGVGFYPAAFHGIAATMNLLTSSGPLVTGNVLALVVSAPLWVAGCVLLVRQLLGPSRLAMVVAGVASAMFSEFPYYYLGHGVHWPNSLGNALLPATMACLLAVVGPTRRDVIGPRRGLVLAVVAVPGIGIAHPNASIALVVVAYLMVLVRVAPRLASAVRARRFGVVATVIAFVVAIPAAGLVATRVVPALRSVSSFDWPAPQRLPQAIGEVALFATGEGGAAAWVATVFVVTGIVMLARRGGPWWPVAVLVAFSGLYALASGVDSPVSQLLTGPWYNDDGRLASLVPLGAVPLATVGMVALVRALARRRFSTFAAAAVTLAAVVVVTSGLYRSEHMQDMIAYHQPSQSLTYATSVEQRALSALGNELPRDAVVASNPWNGSQLLYALTGRKVLFAHFKPALTPDRLLIAEHADDVDSDPRVCAAMKAERLTHVLTSSEPIRYWPWSPRTKQYPGLDAVAGQPGYELVDRAGPYSLWKVTAC